MNCDQRHVCYLSGVFRSKECTLGIFTQGVFNGSITSDKPQLDNEFITISRVSMAIKVFDRNSAVDGTYLSPVHLSPFPLYLFTTKLLLLVLPLYMVSLMMMMIDCRTEALLSVTATV